MIDVDENIYFLYKTTIQRQILFFKVSAKLTILPLPFIWLSVPLSVSLFLFFFLSHWDIMYTMIFVSSFYS